jgi:hypothetical protein
MVVGRMDAFAASQRVARHLKEWTMSDRQEPQFGPSSDSLPEYGATTMQRSFDSASTEESRQVAWLLVIIAGTAIGGLIAYFTVRWYETRQLEIALRQFERTVTDASERSRREMALATERMRLAQAADRQRIAAELERKETAKRQVAELEARRVATLQMDVQQKEAAWLRFFRPSEECRNPDNRVSMTCANEHARAKRDFETKWARGELRPRQ